MNELIVNADGTITVIGDAGSVAGVIQDVIDANTTPATYDGNGDELTAEIIPLASTLAVEITEKPLINMLWLGTILMITGLIIALIYRTRISRL